MSPVPAAASKVTTGPAAPAPASTGSGKPVVSPTAAANQARLAQLQAQVASRKTQSGTVP